MARVIIKLYTTLRQKIGKSEIELESKTLKEALEKIIQKNYELRDIIFEKKGKVKGYFVITINSDVIDNSKISRIRLKDGDIINIFPPVSGG